MTAFHFPSNSRRAVGAFAVLLAIPAAALALMPGIVQAHAIVLAAQPAMNSIVAPGEIEIRLHFNSRVDRKRSRLTLRQPDGAEIAIALAPDSAPGVLEGPAHVTETGPWTLRWQTLSLDGHITRGEVSFSVSGVAHVR